MEKLPVYSLNKKKGNLAADYLKRVISNFAVVNIIDESVDLGIDMRAEVLNETSPIGLFFNIQSKGKDEVDSETEKQGYFTVPIKISTINYWRQQNDVTILFVVDNVMGKCYWCNPLEQIADKISSIQSQDTVTIRVYLNKYIDLSSQECPSSIRQDIMLYMVNQVEHINEKLEKIKKELISGSKVNTKTSIELLKRITKTASQTVGIIKKNDSHLINIFSVTVLEILGNDKAVLKVAKQYMGEKTTLLQMKADKELGRL